VAPCRAKKKYRMTDERDRVANIARDYAKRTFTECTQLAILICWQKTIITINFLAVSDSRFDGFNLVW